MSEKFVTKTIGELTIKTHFFGPHFGSATVKRDRFESEIRLDENEVHDLHYALGRILAEIDEAKRNG